MSAPSNLIRALNTSGKKLHDLFQGKDKFNAYWDSARIQRKRIIVERYETQELLAAAMNKEKELKRNERAMRQCIICDVKCLKSQKMLGCCSDKCYRVKLAQRNESVKQNHWCRSSSALQIRDKRIKTRKKNDESQNRKYTAWNKGKTGVYSLETIEKIRSATRLQFHKELFKKTKIEKKIDDLLKELGINFKYSFILAGRQYDFLLKDFNAVIEVHGDFWHGNPEFWGEGKRCLRDHQIMKKLDDVVKKRIAKEKGYEYFEFWEYDIHNNWSTCVTKIMEIINGNH